METRVLPATEEGILEAAIALQKGGLAVFPTDTVYGVGSSAFLPEAVEALYRVKGRSSSKAIPLLLSKREEMTLVAQDIPQIAWAIAERFWPGGLTIVLPRSPIVPDIVCSGGDTIALRLPDHPIARALIAAVGRPLAVTSANYAGSPPATTAEEAKAALGGLVDIILDGGKVAIGVSSTILDLTSHPPRILRHGAIPDVLLADFLAQFGIELDTTPADQQ